MLRHQRVAPGFTLPGTSGYKTEEYTLQNYSEEGVVVLVFYPFDFSPICTDVLCTLRDADYLMFMNNLDIFGISLDSCYAHERYIDEHNFGFPLLSDPVGRVTEQYDLAHDGWDHHNGVPACALVMIDDTDTVRYTWQIDDTYENPSLKHLQNAISWWDTESDLQYCPRCVRLVNRMVNQNRCPHCRKAVFEQNHHEKTNQ